MYRVAATHARFDAIWAQLVTLAGQLERLAQIPLQALIAIGHEVQTTLDQCERLTPKSLQLEGEREVVVDLVIGYDLAMAQNQPKLTADWFTHRMSATHTPAAAASKKQAMEKPKDQRALGGKDSYQSISASNRPPPHLRCTAPLTNPAGTSAYSPPPHAGWGGGQPDVCTLHQRGQASQPPFHSVPSHHEPEVRSTRTHPAPLPQLESIGRRQRQYRDERKVLVSTDHFRLDLQRHGC